MAGVILASLLGLLGAQPYKEVVVSGDALLLTEALAAFDDLKVDAVPADQQVVIRRADGSLVPLLRDEASRALFDDARLRNRRAEVKAREFSGLPYLQVTSFKVEWEGAFRTPVYYCDLCSISVRYLQACPCCQGDMELRLKPPEP